MTQFEIDLEQDLSVNGKASSKGMWNLIVSKRDLGLWNKGIRPSRNWRVSDVKKYFGLKGNKQKIYEDICKMVDEYNKLPTMPRNDFIRKYLAPYLNEDEKLQVNLGMLDWEDSYLDKLAEGVGLTIDHNASRTQCDGCNEYFEGHDMSHNDDNNNVECETCYGTSY